MKTIDFDPEILIKEVEKRPALWDMTSIQYTDCHVRDQCWKDIVDIFTEEEELTNEERNKLACSLKTKWKSLRASFTRDINRRNALASGDSSGKRKSEYMYFKQLQFLEKITGIRKGSYPQKQEYGYYEVRRPIRLKKQKKKSVSDMVSEDDSIIEEKSNTDYIELHIEQDDDKLFLKSLLTTLKMVPEHKKISTKIQIMTILDEATQINYINYD